MKKTVLLFSLIMAVHSAAFASSPTELRVAISQEYENLNPLVKTMTATTYITQMVNRALTSMDENGKWIPQLVKSIPTLENKQAKLSADKKKIMATFEIRENAKWGDGQDITCADLAFSRQIAMSDNVAVGNKEQYSDIESIDWDSKTPKKCVFTWVKAKWDFYQLADFIPVPEHLEKPIFEKYKDQKEGYEKNSLFTKDPSNPGLYNGPYRVKEVKLADHVTVVINPYFYGTAAKIPSIMIKLIPNTGTLEANLQSGTVDAVSSLGFTFDQALAFEKKVKRDKLPFDVVFKPSVTYEHIDLDLQNPILKDVRVRKALVYAINRPELVKALFENKQQPALHNIAPMDSWFTSSPNDIVLYPYDKKKAAALLDEAGWKLEKDGFRHKDGKRLSIPFMTTAGDKTRENVQVFLQGQWKAVGIEAAIRNEPARVFFGETVRKNKFNGMAMFAWQSMPENSPRTNLHTLQIPSEKNGWSGQNNPSYSNPEVDALLDQLELEFDSAKRKQIVAKILHHYTDEVPVIPLYYRSEVAVIPKNIKGLHLTGTQFSESNSVENWDMK